MTITLYMPNFCSDALKKENKLFLEMCIGEGEKN